MSDPQSPSPAKTPSRNAIPEGASPDGTAKPLLSKWDVVWLSLLPLGIVAAQVAARFPEVVESRFSATVYPRVAGALSQLTSLLPISWAEVLLLAVVVGVVGKVLMAVVRLVSRRRRFRTVLVRGLVDTVSLLGLVYWIFLLVWGFNYYRLPFSRLAGMSVVESSQEELVAVCERTIAKANELRTACAEDADGVADFALTDRDGLHRALAESVTGFAAAGHVFPFLGGSYGGPKAVYASEVMSYLGISGIYSPFTAEANINTTVPQPFLPFTMCHELAHQRGFAREDEANYIGYLTCRLHPEVTFQYSGYLQASLYLLAAVEGDENARLRKTFSPAVERDLEAQRKWRQRYQSTVSKVSMRVNDAYLRVNGQEDGVRSYGRMVDLILAESRR